MEGLSARVECPNRAVVHRAVDPPSDMADRSHDELADLAVKAFELSQTLREQWLTADCAAKGTRARSSWRPNSWRRRAKDRRDDMTKPKLAESNTFSPPVRLSSGTRSRWRRLFGERWPTRGTRLQLLPEPAARLVLKRRQSFNHAIALRHVQNSVMPGFVVAKPRTGALSLGPEPKLMGIARVVGEKSSLCSTPNLYHICQAYGAQSLRLMCEKYPREHIASAAVMSMTTVVTVDKTIEKECGKKSSPQGYQAKV